MFRLSVPISLSIMVFVFLIFIALSGFVDFTVSQSQCVTPNRLYGNCIPIEQCRRLYDLWRSRPSYQDREFLRQSHCGTQGQVTYVCCSSADSPTSPSYQQGSNLFSPSSQQQGSSFYRPSSSSQNFGSSFSRPSTSSFNDGSSLSRPTTYQQGLTESDLPAPGRCGTQTKDRIVGGEETTIQDYPWMALLHYKKHGYPGGYFCGGALIHENYVITAAHCVRGTSLVNSGYSIDAVRLGEHDLRSRIDCEDGDCADPVMDIQVTQMIVHENYEPNSASQNNDIALLRLARPAPYTDFIRPVCLPLARHLRNKNFDRSPLLVAGFGRTENASRSDVKLKLELNGYNLEQCDRVYRYLRVSLNSNHLCAGGEEGRDSCSGDSGGPLTGEDTSNALNPYAYLAGVVSFGPSQCGTPNFPGVYTRIDRYIEWILGHMRR